MLKLTSYVARTVFYTTFIVSAGLMAIYIIISFIDQTSDISSGGYNTTNALLYVLYGVPANLYLILPMAGLLGCLMGLGLLANNSELIVMRSAGFSIFQIAKGVILAGCVIAVIAFFLGAFIAPILSQLAEFNKNISKENNNAVILYNKSLWLKDKSDFIYINKSEPNGTLLGVTRYNFQNNQLTQISTVQSAKFDNKKWQLDNLIETNIQPRGVSIKRSSHNQWDTLVPPQLLRVISSNPDFLTIYTLREYINYNKSNQQDTQSIELQFWQMIFQPISIIILMMIAVPFVFGPMRSSAMGFKLLVGLILGFIFFIINQFFGPFAQVYHIPAFLGAALPSIIFIFVLVLLFWKMRE